MSDARKFWGAIPVTGFRPIPVGVLLKAGVFTPASDDAGAPYTVPAGKQAMMTRSRQRNNGTQSSQFQVGITAGGVFYRGGQKTAIPSGAAALGAFGNVPMLLEGDNLTFWSQYDDIYAHADLVEIDLDARFARAFLPTLASGDQVLFTCPAGKSALMLADGAITNNDAAIDAWMMNDQGDGLPATVHFNVYTSGASPATANQFTVDTAVADGAQAFFDCRHTLEAGDTISINCSRALSGGHAHANVLLLDGTSDLNWWGAALRNASARCLYAGAVGVGTKDLTSRTALATPASGRRWFVRMGAVYNPGPGNFTYSISIKISGVYYQVTPSITVASGHTQEFSTVTLGSAGYNWLRWALESGDGIAIVVTAGSGNIILGVLECDTASQLRTVKLLTPASGDQQFYLTPDGTNALFLDNNGSRMQTSATGFPYVGGSCLQYLNVSGAPRTVTVSYRPAGTSGGSDFALPWMTPNPGGIALSVASGSGAIARLPGVRGGDQIRVSTDSNAAGQMFFGTVAEVPE